MDVEIKHDFSAFGRQFRDYVEGVRTDSRGAARLASKIFTRQLVGMTPPGDGAQAGKATLTKEDQRRGESAIAHDLNALFIGVNLKGKRKEQWPDVDGIHREAFIAVKGQGRDFGRGTNKKTVDIRKVKALSKTLFAHVGRLAALWGRAAWLVDVSLPAWVSRHGIGGQATFTVKDTTFRFEAINPSVPSFLMADMARRELDAERNTGAALERSLAVILQRRADRFNQRSA